MRSKELFCRVPLSRQNLSCFTGDDTDEMGAPERALGLANSCSQRWAIKWMDVARQEVSRGMSCSPCTQPCLVPRFYAGPERWYRRLAHQTFSHEARRDPGHNEQNDVSGCEWWAAEYTVMWAGQREGSALSSTEARGLELLAERPVAHQSLAGKDPSLLQERAIGVSGMVWHQSANTVQPLVIKLKAPYWRGW